MDEWVSDGWVMDELVSDGRVNAHCAFSTSRRQRKHEIKMHTPVFLWNMTVLKCKTNVKFVWVAKTYYYQV